MNYLFWSDELEYPSEEFNYSPNTKYPEYPFSSDTISDKPNKVYDSVRNMFKEMGLDKEHYDTREWNPLGRWVHGNDRVLIKPNFVNHINGSNTNEELDCLVTHPSLIRCILDYVYIAKKNVDNLMIGDAPVIGCDFEALMDNRGYKNVEEFYRVNGLKVPFYDFRMQSNSKYANNNEGIIVKMGKKSSFYGDVNSNYRTPTYDKNNVKNHHAGERQEYSINSNVINADVIINLPKPKTHRKNGYTGAVKNFIGACYNKEYLPHHSKGSISSGGDEFQDASIGTKIESWLNDCIDSTVRKGNFNKTVQFKIAYHLREYIIWLNKKKNITSDPIVTATQGAWYGNNTLWKSVNDMYYCVKNATKEGVLESSNQRTIITLGDMIVSGEHNGPLTPSPKKQNMLLFCDDCIVFDLILTKIMGFDYRKCKGLFNMTQSSVFNTCAYDEIKITSNNAEWNGLLNCIDFSKSVVPFTPADGWKGHIEL